MMTGRQTRWSALAARFLFLLVAWFLLPAGLAAAGFDLIVGEPPPGPLAEPALDRGLLEAARRRRPVALLPELAAPGALVPGDRLRLVLFDDATYHARLDRADVSACGRVTTVRGRLEGYPFGYLLATTAGGRSVVSIRVPERGRKFQVVGTAAGRHYLLELDPARLDHLPPGPPQRVPAPPVPPARVPLQEDDRVAVIDVMVVYTPAARQWAENSGGIDNVIAQAMGRARLVHDNSVTLVDKRLVYAAEVDYVESGDSGIDLRRLTGRPGFEGYFEEVRAWRDEYAADLVALFSRVEDTGGLAWLLNTPAGRPDLGFSLTRVQQAATGYTHIHEMGHNMGADHHKEQFVQPGPGLFSYSAGWRWTDPGGARFSSIMTYAPGAYFPDGLTHPHVAHFSNPEVWYDPAGGSVGPLAAARRPLQAGAPTGHPEDGDNARTVREVRHVVAAYRTLDLPDEDDDELVLPAALEGRLAAVAGVTRGADGSVDLSVNGGDLVVIDLADGRSRQLTAYPDGPARRRVILDPSFSPDGRQVLYTAAVGPAADNPRFRVYLVPADGLAAAPDRHVLAAVPGRDLHYAALSPDFHPWSDPPAGQLVYTRQDGDGAAHTELWLRDLATGLDALIFSEPGRVIRHPVFTEPGVIAFLGIAGGVQDIFTIHADGGGLFNRTLNTIPSPRYGRLQANWRAAAARERRLVYARRDYTGFAWGPWRPWLHRVTGGERVEPRPLSAPAAPPRLDPTFYGRPGQRPQPTTRGLMFYQADLPGHPGGLVQANYDYHDLSASDTWRTPLGPLPAALPAWGPPVPGEPDEPAWALADTCFFLVAGQRLSRADHLDDDWRLTIFNTGLAGPEAHPAPSAGGRLLFEAPQRAGDRLYRILPDGAAVEEYAAVVPAPGYEAVSQPASSPCGRFALYLNLAAPGGRLGPVYYASAQVPGGALLIDVPDAQDPSFSPDLARVVYRRAGWALGDEGIWMQRIHADHAAGTLEALGPPRRLTQTAAGVTNRQPAFSPDGRHIVFVSDRLGGDGLFVIEAGRGEAPGRRAAHVAGGDNLAPAFGPPGPDRLSWRLAWVRGGEILTGFIDRRQPGVVTGETATGLFPDPGAEKFAWAPVRASGGVAARRYLQGRSPAGAVLEYTVSIEVDETAPPTGYTVGETLPAGWRVHADPAAVGDDITAVTINGAAADPAYANIVDNGDGTRTLRLVFSNNPALPAHHRAGDRLLAVPLVIDAGGTIAGRVSYTAAGANREAPVSGPGRVSALNPPLPVDVYDGDGRRWDEEETRPAGGHAVGDFDLLFAIDAWAADVRLAGPGGAWPAAVGQWDGIILAVIDTWASPAGSQGQFVESDGAGVGTADPAGHTGEYAYVGRQRDPANDDPLLNIYTGTYTTGGAPGNSRAGMYWTPGAWTD